MINYYLLTKPGIILGNLIPFAAGFLLAAKGAFDFWLFIQTLLGLALIMASACVFNNYIDRHLDQKMQRTQNRAFAKGNVSKIGALTFASLMLFLGLVMLWRYTNPLATAIAVIGFGVYVFLYSFWKARTVYGTAIGSIAGAVPPVVGYCAVSQHFDLGALILFAMLVLWQMPHFFAIALYRLDDYAAAKIPVLPLVKGILQTKIHMLIYILGFMGAAALLTLSGYTGYLYLMVAVGGSLIWLGISLKGFFIHNNELWGRQMFRASLLLMTAICIAIPLDIAR